MSFSYVLALTRHHGIDNLLFKIEKKPRITKTNQQVKKAIIIRLHVKIFHYNIATNRD